jgi:hypothetical protein
MSDTTSILDLRTDPIGGGNSMGSIGNAGNISNNISLTSTENVVVQPSSLQPQPNMVLDEKTISQIVSGLQQASTNGSTLLQSRDIPMTTTNISNDPQIQPNYIPTPMQNQGVDYINNYEQTSDMIENYNRGVQQNHSLKYIAFYEFVFYEFVFYEFVFYEIYSFLFSFYINLII